ncbi:Cytochrome c oxidase subunit 3 [Roseimaritima multifibrata]|uniref:Cytochrome c oxidase subunit 3 n=1 Tax=Roseimaritima multifibrata TaxID=1930274 RepID=A0A517MCN5_9BACT|nr:cytochrome c oxidase subunit 3 [Roseimaritima multifibrata]QDS92635.1 Cytochrome c oxidase subunit 3 [Roseimaritima multifibrata]
MAETTADAHHGHDDHEHHENLAHHFDSYEQQFDAGKLGIWLFLVTEVLFFGGMFCAYALYRNLRPEVFEGCSEFLNTQLGAINTGVLLFSSLTMAWAVRCAQLRQHKMLIGMLAATLSCAAIFLGVKAVEYSHKFGMGLLPAGLYTYDPLHPHHADAPNYLAYICVPFAIIAVFVIGWLILAFLQKDEFKVRVLKPLTVVCLCFFAGVGLGTIIEAAAENAHGNGEAHASVAHGEHGDEAGHGSHDEEGHEDHTVAADGPILASDDDLIGLDVLAKDSSNPGAKDNLRALKSQSAASSGAVLTGDEKPVPNATEKRDINTPKQAGIFFGIYYCMTGVHAIHILAGMGVMVWLLIRAVRAEFNEKYFGPVDFVGLYWHLVDLIWIYLFPLLYLIG